MHIAYVTTTYPPETGWGGIGTYVYHMARGMSARGHNVTILCGYNEAPSESNDGNLRIVRRIPCDGLAALERSKLIARLVEHEIHTQGVNVVEFAEYRGDGVVFQRRNPAFPTVVKLHCPTRLCSIGESPLWQRPFRWLFIGRMGKTIEQLEKESVARASVVVSPSQWLLRVLQKTFWRLPRLALRIPNPFGGWPGESGTLTPSKDYSAPDVLFLGRLARLKGAELVPKIMRMVWRQVPSARFEFIGQDTPRSKTENWGHVIMRSAPQQQRQQITLRGGIPYLDLPDHLARHSIAVFASTLENFPYATMECMWSGLACVVGSRGGAHELGDDGVSAMNTPCRTANIAEAVIKLLQNPSLRSRIGSVAREHVQSEFGLSHIAEKMEAVYQHAMGTNVRIAL
jgi:glycogen synthase